MSEYLDINCGSLRREIGRFLGFDRDPANWGTNEAQDVWDILDSGLRQFYRPPRLPGERMSYQWKFLRPIGTITVESGIDDYDLPEDFAGIDGLLYFSQADVVTASSVRIVNHSMLLQRRQAYWYTNSTWEPQLAAIVPKSSQGVQQQSYQLMIWPKPDETYTLKFRYYARQRPMRNDWEVPLGAEEHAETILLSCLAAAEIHLDDEEGPRYRKFIERLMASMDWDRRIGSPKHLGKNLDFSAGNFRDSGEIRAIGGLVTLEAYPPDVDTPTPGQLETQDGALIDTQDGAPVTIQ